MACEPEILREVPLFARLDDDETAVLAAQVEVKTFAPRQRIYRIGDPGGRAYVMVSGAVRVTTVDEDQQDVIVDEPTRRSASASRTRSPASAGRGSSSSPSWRRSPSTRSSTSRWADPRGIPTHSSC